MNKLDFAVLSLRTDSKVAQGDPQVDFLHIPSALVNKALALLLEEKKTELQGRRAVIFSGYLIGVRYFAQKGLILPSS